MVSAIIVVMSAVLFLYWLRYACLLILRTRTTNYAKQVAEINGLSFPEAQHRLSSISPRDDSLTSLHESLDRDYRVVTYLLSHAGTQNGQSIEEHLLRLDYHIMRLCYRISRPLSRGSARHALAERACIISHLANAIGERGAVS